MIGQPAPGAICVLRALGQTARVRVRGPAWNDAKQCYRPGFVRVDFEKPWLIEPRASGYDHKLPPVRLKRLKLLDYGI